MGNKRITKRELQVLQLIANGNTDERIAQMLAITMHTANAHRKQLLLKMKVKNAAMLVAEAFRKNLIT